MKKRMHDSPDHIKYWIDAFCTVQTTTKCHLCIAMCKQLIEKANQCKQRTNEIDQSCSQTHSFIYLFFFFCHIVACLSAVTMKATHIKKKNAPTKNAPTKNAWSEQRNHRFIQLR